jgi:RHS repeat-associated protein
MATNSNEPTDLPLAVVDDVATTPVLLMVHSDHLGRPIRMTDSTKATVWTASYKPWGEPLSISGTKALNLRFPGQYFQIETALSYNWHRHYDTTTGRYTQPDPLGFVNGPSVYAYSGNSPFMNSDASGLDCTASGGSVTCSAPNGGPTVSFPRPEGWPSYIGPNSSFYHNYDIPVNVGNKPAACILTALIQNPTPGSPNPATAAGTGNNATPSGAQAAFDALDALSSFGNDMGGYNNSPVISYITGGGSVVVNVTLPGHPLFPGYVARTVTPNSGGTVIHNFGEGTSFLQSQYSPLAGTINGIWNQQSSDLAAGATGCGCN